MSKRAEEVVLKAYPIKGEWVGNQYGEWDNDINRPKRNAFLQGYEQAEKDIKEAIVKHFKYKQDHSPEHTLHWWVYKNVIDKVNEL